MKHIICQICDAFNERSRVCSVCGSELPKVERTYKKKHKKQTKEYACWAAMKSRCLNVQNPQFNNYGERGIKVCDRWLNSFENFLFDMGKCPPGLTIDRIDNDGDYEPGNCRWATMTQQSRNKRNNIWITINGETKVLTDWCNELDICRMTVSKRIKDGMSKEDAIRSTLADSDKESRLVERAA